MRTREDVWSALDDNFKRLMECIGQLTEEELTDGPAVGEWTAKDVLAHVWACGDQAVAVSRVWHKAQSVNESIHGDAWNEAQVAAKRGLPLITVVEGITAAHRRLSYLLDSATDEALAQQGRAPWGDEMSLLDFIDLTGEHYAEHAQGLAAYQKHCLNPDDPNCA